MIDARYYVNVADLMLPRPSLKNNVLDNGRAESLSELQVLPVKCVDVDYYDG